MRQFNDAYTPQLTVLLLASKENPDEYFVFQSTFKYLYNTAKNMNSLTV